jgi:hypothetical protein
MCIMYIMYEHYVIYKNESSNFKHDYINDHKIYFIHYIFFTEFTSIIFIIYINYLHPYIPIIEYNKRNLKHNCNDFFII